MSDLIESKPTPAGALIQVGNGGVTLTSMQQVVEFSRLIAGTPFAHGQKDVRSVAACITWGLELGLTPFGSLRAFAVINGRPTIYGDALPGIVMRSGLCEGLSEHVVVEDGVTVATCSAWRKGWKLPTVRKFSEFDAQRAGLWNKPGPWKQYPERMLQMRARAWCLRDTFADVLCGMGVAEEVRDTVVIEYASPEPPIRPNVELREVIDGPTSAPLPALAASASAPSGDLPFGGRGLTGITMPEKESELPEEAPDDPLCDQRAEELDAEIPF